MKKKRSKYRKAWLLWVTMEGLVVTLAIMQSFLILRAIYLSQGDVPHITASAASYIASAIFFPVTVTLVLTTCLLVHKLNRLVEKLLEYKMYKYMSFELRDMELDAAKSFYREKDVPREVEAYRPPLDYNELLKDMTLAKLQEIFEGILKRQEDKKDPVRSNFGRIEKDEVSVDQKAVYVEDFIRTHKRFSFRALLEKQHSKVEVIVTFLVVLELMKTGKITVEQASINDDMTVISREEQMA